MTTAISIAPMRFSFEYTYAEFEEAQLAHAQAVSKSNTTPKLWARAWLFASLFGLIAISLVADNDKSIQIHDPFVSTILPALPAACFLLFIWLHSVDTTRRPPLRPWTAPAASPVRTNDRYRFFLMALGWPVGIVIATLFMRSGFSADRPNGNATLAALFPLAILTYCVIGLYVTSLKAVNGGRQIMRAWQDQVALHGPREFEITDRGLSFQTSAYDVQYRWDHFRGYYETPNLFLLYNSSAQFYIIPKRLFVDQQSLDAFCGLLQTRIPEGRFLARPAAFPVVAPSSPAVTRA